MAGGKKAATRGIGAAFVSGPPVTHQEAEAEFGNKIPKNAWTNIITAFHRHELRLADHASTISENKNPNDKRGSYRLFNQTERQLKAAQQALLNIDSDFMSQVFQSNAPAFQRADSKHHIVAALDQIGVLCNELQKFKPISRELPSEADSRAQLARDVFDALKDHGATLSNGWAVRSENNPSEAELTGFERLAGLLGIHDGATPAATSKWLREAMAQKE